MERGSTLAIVVASFLWAGFPGAHFLCGAAAAQEPGAKDDGPEDRLLRAQLFEVSTGDIEKAKAIYQAIQGDEKAPESTRALALLYLARCHRKLGEIDSAKKVLDELVRTHEKQRDVIRQARSFLRELTSGKPESPDFDWLKELEKSPEIQARVFDLAMDLTERPSDAGNRAWRQLLALGTIGVPVIERVLESTRSPAHRQQLAVILVRLGRFERLPIVFDPRLSPSGDLHSIQVMISALDEGERVRLRTELERVPSAEATAPFRDALLLAAGDRSALAQKLASIEKTTFSFLGSDLLDRVLKEEPSAIDFILGRILDTSCKFKKDYFDAVLRMDPTRLAVEHWSTVLTPKFGDATWNDYIGGIEERGDFALLVRLAALPGDEHRQRMERLVIQFNKKYVNEGKLTNAPAGWAAVLRSAAATVPTARGVLRSFAEVNDAAIGEFVHALLSLPPKNASERFDPFAARPEKWVPSTRLIEAMAGLLDQKNAYAQSLALDILAEAPKETPDQVFAAIEGLRERSENQFVRRKALFALFRQFEAGKDIGPRLAQSFIDEHERMLREDQQESADELKYAPRQKNKTPRTPRTAGPKRLPVMPSPGGFEFPEFLKGLNLDGKKDLYPHIVALADSEAGSRFHDVYFRAFAGKSMAAVASRLARALETAKSKAFRESAVHLISDMRGGDGDFPKEDDSRVLAFLRAAAVDESLAVEARLMAFLYPDEPPFEWFDWEKLLGGPDPLAGSFLKDVRFLISTGVPNPADSERKKEALTYRLHRWLAEKPDADREGIYQAALQSPQPDVRRFAVMAYRTDSPGALDFLRQALSDDDKSVSREVIERLKNATRGDLAPLAVDLLKNPDRGMRLSGIELQKRFLSPEGIEPLAALLNDSDVEVRSKALEALREVRKAFEEKKEWDLIRQGLLPSPLPAPKKDAEKNDTEKRNTEKKEL